MKAIISDIHGNLEGLVAVLSDIKAQGISEILCLGDVVGYGPNPRECIDLVMDSCQMCLLGNHDQGALFDPEGFNAGAERAIFWTRKMLESGDPKGNERRWEFLGELPRMSRRDNFLYVHGSARNPLNEYVFPEDIYNQRKMERIFGLVDKYCFQGHTHIPGIFTEDLNFLSPEEIDGPFVLGDQKILVNVGSVGQPRNGDSRSCYVVLDGGANGREDTGVHAQGEATAATADASSRHVEAGGGSQESDQVGTTPVMPTTGEPAPDATVLSFHHVEYDFETTAEKIYAIPELDNFLGDRLRDGR